MAIRFLIYKKDLIHVLFLTFLVSGKSCIFSRCKVLVKRCQKPYMVLWQVSSTDTDNLKFITLFKIMTLVASSNKINLSVSIGWFSCPFLTTKFICNKGFRSDSVGTYFF